MDEQIRITLSDDARVFNRHAAGFLEASLERNVLATVAAQLLGEARPQAPSDARYAVGVDARSGEVVAAALRTPPRHLISAGFLRPAAAAELIRSWLAHDPQLSGVSAAPAEALELCRAFSRITGGRTERQFSEALYVLDEVRRPAAMPPGSLRVAREQELDLISRWLGAFSAETGFGDPGMAAHNAARFLADGRMHVWDAGEPVTLVGNAVSVAGVSRVGPVYTPPEHRRRGYAGAAVAVRSQQLLDQGAARCMLFADLANATANRIYTAVGYSRAGAWEEHRFLADLDPSPPG